ncbi:MAG: energy transducer TonB [Gemmatimonadaceae bacterium]
MWGSSAHAQTVAGRVRDYATRTPIGFVTVALVDDSAHIVGRAQAAGDGVFYLDAPRAGGYRVLLFASGGESFLSPVITVADGAFEEREFFVPAIAAQFRDRYFVHDVTTRAVLKPKNPLPRYPGEMREKNFRGTVTTMFVVDDKGVPETSTFQAISKDDRAFIDAIRDVLGRTRFFPAVLDGKPVRQVVQLTFAFGFPGDTLEGDVIVRAAGVRALAP